MSAARAPWVHSAYVHAKREAESYIGRIGLKATIIRAPVAYIRGQRRHPFYWLMTFLGSMPPTMWFIFGRIAPLPIDILARGVARITLEPTPGKTIYYRRDVRRRNTHDEAHRRIPATPLDHPAQEASANLFDLVDEDTPFGWSPPDQP